MFDSRTSKRRIRSRRPVRFGGDVRESGRVHAPPIDALRISHIIGVEIVLTSKHVRAALLSLVSYWPSMLPFEFEAVMTIPEPFTFLVHHYPAMNAYLDSQATTQGSESVQLQVAHIKVLRDYLKEYYDSSVRPTIDSLSQPVPVIEFDMLWYLFKPGEDVYIQTSESALAAVVTNVLGPSRRRTRVNERWAVQCWNLATNGYRVGRSFISQTLERYTGSRAVTSLPVCPAAIWDAHDGGERRASIIARSTMYADALRAGSLHARYDGPDLLDGQTVSLLVAGQQVGVTDTNFDSITAALSLIIFERGVQRLMF